MAMTAPGTPGKLSGDQDLRAHDADAGVGQRHLGRVTEVEDPAVDVRASIVDQEEDVAAVLGDEEDRAQRQLLAGARPALLVVDGAAGGRPAVESGPVPRGRAGEHLAGGLQPGWDTADRTERILRHQGSLVDRRHPVTGARRWIGLV